MKPTGKDSEANMQTSAANKETLRIDTTTFFLLFDDSHFHRIVLATKDRGSNTQKNQIVNNKK